MNNATPPAPASEPGQPAEPAAAPATTPATEPTPPAEPAPAAPPPQPPSAPTEPAPPPAIGPDGKLGENWFLALGDEFAAHAKDLGKHKDMRSLITELDYFRKNGVEYPGEGAQPSAIDRFRKVAGVPDAPEGYGLTAETAGLPDGVPFDAELAAAVTKAAHDAHTPPAALHAIAKEFNAVIVKRIADAQAEAEAQTQAAQDALVAEWRGDFQQNASTVRHLTSKLADLAGVMPDDPTLPQLANNPAFARMMLQVSRMTSEDRIQTPTGYGDLRSPAQRIAEITSGRDPVWGQKWVSGTAQEKAEAYEFVKQLRDQAAQ